MAAKTVKSKYFTVTANIKSKTDTSATVTWTWKVNRGYFGYCNSKEALALKGANGYLKHLGIPKRWDSKWGYRSTNLTDGKTHKVVNSWGSLKGLCADSGSYTETVHLNRGVNRTGTQKIIVGVEGTKEEKKDWECLVTLSVTTKSVKEPEEVSPIQVILTKTTIGQMQKLGTLVSIVLTYKNPDKYYTATLYSQEVTSDGVAGKKTKLAVEDVANNPGRVEKDYTLFNALDFFNNYYNRKFIVEITGEDGRVYATQTWGPKNKKGDPQSWGLTIYAKVDGEIKDITDLYIKNRNNKKIPEVYGKLTDGEIKQFCEVDGE